MFQMAYIYAQIKKGAIPDIYLQDPKYFEGYENDIRGWFGEGIGFIEQISIHIRRGDYVDNPFYVDLTTTDYYERAIGLFPDKNFLVFTDDVDFAKGWVEQRPDRARFQVMEGNSEIEDFNIMASCEGNIIANSSFSWWAAYVNPNPSKKVTAPLEWYADKIERTVCPPEWTRI